MGLFSLHSLVSWLVVGTLMLVVADARQFNLEVEKRIRERLDFFVAGPVDTGRILSGFRRNGGFPNNMDAADRDRFLALAYSVTQPLVYFGLEDGTCPGYYWSSGYYREPGNSGYAIDNPEMQKHLNSCVDAETGAPTQCLLNPGASYIACRGGEEGDDEGGLCPQIEPCPNQPACPANDEQCNATVKWCRQYNIVQAPSDTESTGRGFIPITNFCHDDRGHFTQEPGTVLDPFGDNRETDERSSCRFGDGSLVQRNLSGDYAACGNNVTCDTVFAGGYSSSEYDPRYRPWYINTREQQRPNWTPPFAFFTLGLGITYAEPIYTTEEGTGRQIFAGVIAVDYRFEDIANFLIESYGETDTAVIVYEAAEPNYVIASSTGSPSSRFMLSDNLSEPCPVDRGEGTGCEPVRMAIDEYGDGHPMDPVLVKAAATHREEGYPEELLSVTVPNDASKQVYLSQSTVFTQEGTELSWRVVVVEPAVASTSDFLTVGDPLFSVLCVVAALGCLICAMFALAIYRRRDEKAVVFADWRFTCAFIMGCFLFNASSFALLGKNTKTTCLLRMWTFHFSFVLALSPLFVKVWRMYKLVGSSQIRRNTISNLQAAMYTLPMIIAQTILLVVFTFVDPPRPTEYTQQNEGEIVYGVVCDTETNVAFITLGVYDFAFVFAGCILAYMTRNMQDDFGEAKQMIFSMYNIFFVGLVVLILVQFIGLEGVEQSILQAVGVFWGTVFSAGAFAIPRLLQVRDVRRERREGRSSASNVHVSGLAYTASPTTQEGAGPRSSSLDIIEESEMEEFKSEDLGPVQDSSGKGTETVDSEQALTSQLPRVARINFAGEVSDDST